MEEWIRQNVGGERRGNGRPGLWLSLLLAVALLCLSLAGLSWRRERTRAEQAAVPLADPLANLNQVGVNANLDQYVSAPSGAELERHLAQIAGAGFRWVRQRFPWPEIEPQRGEYNWDAWDAIVDGCEAHDLRLIAVLDGSPAWAHPQASPGDTVSTVPPQEVAEWGAFVDAVAERYRGQIAAYQIWDEPNLAAHWGGQYVAPVAYLALLREASVRIRDADPGAPVVTAALAPTLETGPLNLNEAAFLRQVVEAGGRPYLDVVAVQPYGFAAPPDQAQEPLSFQRAASLRRALVRLGLGDRPVWATAWGWNALPKGWSGAPSPWPAVAPEQQATYTVQALELARREWPWMGPMIVATYQPHQGAPGKAIGGVGDPRWGFSLVDAQGTPGPTWQRLAAYNSASRPLYTGVYSASPDNAQFEGAWRFARDGFFIAADPPHGADAGAHNATLAFEMVGSALDLAVRRGDYWAVLYVSIDGQAANGLPRDEKGRSYLVLYDPAGQTERVTVARGLSPREPHRVEIVAHGGWGQWPLLGWTVRGEEPLSPASAQGNAFSLALIGVCSLLAAFGVVLTAPALRRPLYTGLGRLFRWYRGLPEPLPILATLGAAAAFYWIPWTPLALPFLVLWAVLAFLRIDLGLATVALALPLYARPKALFGRPVSVVELSLALCLAAWAAARLLDWGRQLSRSAGDQQGPLFLRLQQWLVGARTWPARLLKPSVAIDVGVALLLLLALSSVEGWAPRAAAQREWRTLFFESALFYALIRIAVRSPRAQRRVAEGWLLGAAGIAAVGLGQWLLGQNLIAAEGTWRVRGFFGSPNNLALYLGRALPVLIAVAWQGPHADRAGKARRWVYGVVALGVLGVLLLTRSRGALLLGLPAALLALGLFQRSRRALWFSLGALAVLALLLLPLGLGERLLAFARNPTQGTGFFRLKLWRSTLNMLADHPLRGVGLDGFLYAYRSRYVLPSAWGELNLSHPHNLLLDAWTRLGLLGVGVVGWLLYWFFRLAWRQFREALGYRRALLLGALAAMAAALAHGLVDQAFYTVDLAFAFMLLLALVQG